MTMLPPGAPPQPPAAAAAPPMQGGMPGMAPGMMPPAVPPQPGVGGQPTVPLFNPAVSSGTIELAFLRKLEGDPINWPDQVLSYAFQEHPFLAQYEPVYQVVRADYEKGYMVGILQISSGQPTDQNLQQIQIPFTVKNKKLDPISVFLLDGKAFPLTQARLERATVQSSVQQSVPPNAPELEHLFQDQEVDAPGSLPDPYMNRRMSYKLGSVRSSDLEAVTESLRVSPALAKQFPLEELKKIARGPIEPVFPTWNHHTTFLVTPEKTRYRVQSTSEGFRKVASKNISRKQAAMLVGEEKLHYIDKGGYAVSTTQSVKLAEGLGQAPEEVSRAGVWHVKTTEGISLLGMVFPQVYDFSGALMPFALFFDGEHAATQDKIMGVFASEITEIPPAGDTSGELCFVYQMPDGFCATVPFALKMEANTQYGEAMVVETFLGETLQIVHLPDVMTATQIDAQTVAVPASWTLVRTGDPSARVDLVEDPAGFESFSEIGEGESLKLSWDQGFRLAGAGYDLKGLSTPETVLHLTAVGAPNPQELIKRAQEFHTIKLFGRIQADRGEQLEKLANQIWSARERLWNRNRPAPLVLVKAASLLFEKSAEDPTIDAVLALGFVRPENTQVYQEYAPLLELAARKLASLLLASQWGYEQIPSTEARVAMYSIEKVLEGLQFLNDMATPTSSAPQLQQ